MENPNTYPDWFVVITIISAFITTLGALASIFERITKNRAEKRKIDSEADSALSTAVENIADSANMTIGLFKQVMTEQSERWEKEKENLLIEIADVKQQLGKEQQARLSLETDILMEKKARIEAEKKMTALQGYIEELKTLMRKANIEPPPFRWLG